MQHLKRSGAWWAVFLTLVCGHHSLAAATVKPQPVPFRVPARLPEPAELLAPGAIELGGFIGQRVGVNQQNRLLPLNEEPLLAGFRQKPGSHPWIGEHVGKWMHAASLAWAHSGDPALRAKLDHVAAELIRAQEPDGYLGTYSPDKRFGLYPGADWDVWSHKYNLMGLLTYYQYSGNAAALDACRKMGDLLVATFGPGKKSILSAGTHVGMAATSVLEPMVLLYRHTGDPRYLEFARYLVRAWDETNGPKIIAALLKEKTVNKTANAKAYEMLSNLVGLCELARVTGERSLLDPVLAAWEDIVAKRLYLTGSASQGEHFRGDFELPNQVSAHVAETCVTTTWVQLNSQLLRLTGEARFADELERTFYNHLTAAQRPDGAQWCYFTSLEGTKPYGPGINCCVSSGPRGLALAPPHAWLKFTADGREGLALSLFDASSVTAVLNGQKVTLEHQTEFPRRGQATLRVRVDKPAAFPLRIRAPAWAEPLRVQSERQGPSRMANGWLELPARDWLDGDTVTLNFSLTPRLIDGAHGNAGRRAVAWGPFVLAYDQDRNPRSPNPRWLVLGNEAIQPPFSLAPGPGLAFATTLRSAKSGERLPAVLRPFADAGSDGGSFRVWLRAPDAPLPLNESLFADAQETRSRTGNQTGSIADGEYETLVVTFDGKAASEDWFAVQAGSPVTIGRVVFAHGRSFHDGGWFDASAGKPRVQVQRERNGPWETVAELADYPATTATDPRGLKDGQAFSQRLVSPIQGVGLRVIGKPASGDNPNQAFASCAELQAFEL